MELGQKDLVGLTLIQRDGGHEWKVERINEKGLAILKGQNNTTISKRAEVLLQDVQTEGSPWSRKSLVKGIKKR